MNIDEVVDTIFFIDNFIDKYLLE